MKLKIKKELLKVKVSDHEGNVKVYGVDLKDVEADELVIEKIIYFKEEIRSLLRSKNNLKDAIEFFITINNIKDNGHEINTIKTSLFSYGVSLYGACFLKGGLKSEYPMRRLFSKIKDNSIHKEIMTHRNKLVSHLDENHELRSDDLIWCFSVQEEKLTPQKPNISGNKILFNFGLKNMEWIDHMKSLIGLIDIEVDKLTEETLPLLQDLKFY